MQPELSLIVCYRNEAANLPSLLKTLRIQTYKAFELILVDDFSEDNGATIIKSLLKDKDLSATFIDLKKHLGEEFRNTSNKKRGISLALSKSQTNTILLTDADCIMGPKWIESMLYEFQIQKLALGFGPVCFSKGTSLFTSFQEIDLMAMMACTKWTIRHKIPMLGNAANMIFDKNAFIKLNGYADNIHLPSGDDIFLLQQFIAADQLVGFIETKDNIVLTNAEESMEGFVQQRIRWAGKSTAYKNNAVKLTLLGIYGLNLLLVMLLPLTVLSLVPVWTLPLLFSFKLLIDSLIIYPTLSFFNRKKLILGMPIFECIHILYVVSIGFLSLKKSYIWKGRQINQ